MDRRNFLGVLGAGFIVGIAPARADDTSQPATPRTGDMTPIDKPKAEWKQLLEPERYEVLFKEATERAGTSPLNKEKRDGTFICAACYLPLFDARFKFESGTGWPSFYDTLPDAVDTKRDFKLVWPRTEYHCARCGGHQGHLFEDGPKPTGLRYCNNGLALQFVPDGETLPDLRS
ncbi:MAG: peptide-methionine (R)-S-oxide reductase MsrB [Gammaproteobacteria bacterium]|nr:peptide-methionine (R)-S-oxide reductase MsrB [Gammaproteobacteria bacterium]